MTTYDPSQWPDFPEEEDTLPTELAGIEALRGESGEESLEALLEGGGSEFFPDDSKVGGDLEGIRISSVVSAVRRVQTLVDAVGQGVIERRGKTRCPGCGAMVSEGARFCGACGAAMKAEAPPDEPRCPSCGASIRPGVNFCGSCGQPVAHST